MTVKELIAKLSKLEQDKEIGVHNQSGFGELSIDLVSSDAGLNAYAVCGEDFETDLIHGCCDGYKVTYESEMTDK